MRRHAARLAAVRAARGVSGMRNTRSIRADGGLAGSRLAGMALSRADDWETPPEVFDPLNREFGFTLDVAAQAHNAKCDRFISPDDDGLVSDWGANVCWCN